MELRDTFSDRNNIDRLINIFQKAILDSEERIQDIEQDEQKGIQKFSLANEVVISNIRSSIFRYQKEKVSQQGYYLDANKEIKYTWN